MGAARVRHPAEEAVEFQALGRGELGVDEGVPDHIAVGADEADLRPPGLKHMLEDLGGAGLAAGAREADQLHGGGGIAIEFPACQGEAAAAVRHLNIGGSVRRRVLAENGGGPLLHRCRNKAVAVGREALDGDEEVAGLGLSRVVADAADLKLRVGGARQNIQMFQQLTKLHVLFLRIVSTVRFCQYFPSMASSLSISVTSTTVP